MIVECVRDKGWDVPADHRGPPLTAQVVFYLTVNQTYRVHGLALYNGGLCVLLLNDTELPNWYPVEAFTVVDSRLSTGWRFVLRDKVGYAGIQALWGYPELIENPNHFSELAELETSALTSFFEAASVTEFAD